MFLNSPYRETPKNVLKKKSEKKKVGGWLVPRELIKYTSRSVHFFFECPSTFKHDRAVAVVLNTGVTQERRRRHFRSPEQLQAAAAAGDEGISPAIAIEHFF